MAIDGFHVNGTALVYVGTVSSVSLLGYTDGGVDLDHNFNLEEIYTDVFGPRTPHDMQDMGRTGILSIPLIASDRTLLSSAMHRGDMGAVGQLGTPGLPLGTYGYSMAVRIASSFDTGWSFLNCFLRPTARTKLGVKANPFTLQFLCLPVATAQTTSGRNAQLYVRV